MLFLYIHPQVSQYRTFLIPDESRYDSVRYRGGLLYIYTVDPCYNELQGSKFLVRYKAEFAKKSFHKSLL